MMPNLNSKIGCLRQQEVHNKRQCGSATNVFVDLKKQFRNLFIFYNNTQDGGEKTKQQPTGRIAVFSKVGQGVIFFISTK